jgi:uncharacterized protein (DUF2141 family)
LAALIRNRQGELAVSAREDLNSNSQFDRSILGIPDAPNPASDSARRK